MFKFIHTEQLLNASNRKHKFHSTPALKGTSCSPYVHVNAATKHSNKYDFLQMHACLAMETQLAQQAFSCHIIRVQIVTLSPQ